jgi:hypothetical protein
MCSFSLLHNMSLYENTTILVSVGGCVGYFQCVVIVSCDEHSCTDLLVEMLPFCQSV